MQNELVKQWIDSNKLAIESFKNITSTNVNAMDAMLTSFVNPSAFAELSKSYLSLTKELGEVYTDSINELFQSQLKLVNLQATSDSFKDLGEIYVSSMTSLGLKQAELMRLYLETTAKYLDILKGAQKVDDLFNVQTSIFSELQEKLQENMLETMGVFNSINTALDNWTQKSLDAFASDES
jgi:hypothetical protein